MKTDSRYSQNVYAIRKRIWCNRHLRHTTTENMKTMGKVDTSDLMVIITTYTIYILTCMFLYTYIHVLGSAVFFHYGYIGIFGGFKDQRKQQNSASQAFVRGTHRWPVNSLHKLQVTRKKFPFDDVIMNWSKYGQWITSFNHSLLINGNIFAWYAKVIITRAVIINAPVLYNAEPDISNDCTCSRPFY